MTTKLTIKPLIWIFIWLISTGIWYLILSLEGF